MTRERTSTAIAFADVSNSTRLFERLGDRRARDVIGRVLSDLAEIAEENEGRVVKVIGDEIMVTFPRVVNALLATSAMQHHVSEKTAPEGVSLAIRVGLHHGDVILEEGDVFGDAVNVAARMVGIATAGQIITTRETADVVTDDMEISARSLGSLKVRGKAENMEICEVLWEEETEELTAMADARTREALEDVSGPGLVLRYGDERIEVERSSFKMGRGGLNHLVVKDSVVSRSHATIEHRNNKYFLLDHSTNGTYIRTGGDPEIFVHREEVHLHGEGQISMGQSASSESAEPIRYVCRR